MNPDVEKRQAYLRLDYGYVRKIGCQCGCSFLISKLK